MTQSIRNSMPTPLEAEYKRLLKENSKPSENETTGRSLSQGDVVNLSAGGIDAAKASTELKPSEPVTPIEMQALQSFFSIYG